MQYVHCQFESNFYNCAVAEVIIYNSSSSQTSTKSSIDSLIRVEVAKVVRDSCQCDFQKSFISQAVLLCDQQQPTQTVYRASITSYGNYSANHLLDYIEVWVKQGATITSGVVIVTFDPDCPVKINDVSDPVCAQPSTSVVIPMSTSVVTPTLTPSAPNTLAVIAASLTVVVIIVAVTTAVIIILIICVLKQKKKM